MPTDVTKVGKLKIAGLPEGVCFESFESFLKAMTEYFLVEIPDTITNVIVSNIQPLDSQRNYVWFRKDNSGGFVGIYLYGAGTWNKVFPVEGQIFRVVGDSSDLPKGFMLADSTNPNLTAAMAAHLQTQWLLDPGGSGNYVIFDVTFEGF